MDLIANLLRRTGLQSPACWQGAKQKPDAALVRAFVYLHELMGISRDDVPDVRQMSEPEFDDYIQRLQEQLTLLQVMDDAVN